MLRVSNLSKCFSQNISTKKGFSLIVFASKWRSWIYWSYFFSEERNKFVRVSFDRAILCSTSVLMTVVTWVHLTNHIAPNKRCTVDKDTGNKFLLCSSSIIVLYLKNSHDNWKMFELETLKKHAKNWEYVWLPLKWDFRVTNGNGWEVTLQSKFISKQVNPKSCMLLSILKFCNISIWV